MEGKKKELLLTKYPLTDEIAFKRKRLEEEKKHSTSLKLSDWRERYERERVGERKREKEKKVSIDKAPRDLGEGELGESLEKGEEKG